MRLHLSVDIVVAVILALHVCAGFGHLRLALHVQEVAGQLAGKLHVAPALADRQADLVARDQGIVIHSIGFGDPNAEGEQRLDAEQLQRIAAITGGRYLHASNQRELAAAFDALDRLTPQLQQRLEFQPRTPLYWYPLAAMIAVLLLRLLLSLPLPRRAA